MNHNLVIVLRRVKLSDVNSSVKMTWPSTWVKVHATLSANQIQLCFFVSIAAINRNVTRKNLQAFEYFNDFSSFDGNLYQRAESSSYPHGYTYGLANYKGKAITTGCYTSSSCYVKTELMDMNTMKWSNGPNYPFTNRYVCIFILNIPLLEEPIPIL